jgi:TolB-like protein/tetratricopeptide (TPR) repeat protein
VADALDYAHQQGVIHRDIKPENVLIGRGHALVADFGIARALAASDAAGAERLTETGVTVGTPHYMSPEQAAGERELDARTDIYSLGCVLYEMLAGEPPFTGPNQQAVLAKRLSEPVPHVGALRDVSPTLEQAVTRALARSPADRFATAAEFAAALHSSPSTTISAPGSTRSRRAVLAVMLGLVLAAMLGRGFFAIHRLLGARTAPPASAAVLPFTNLSADKDQEYFSDGLTEELITALSQVQGLRVAARTSSFQFKGREPDIHEVGRKLDVGTVLEGSVRKSGNRLRVSAQLVSVKDGYQLWASSYDRDLADVFAVQEEIARAIVSALRVRLTPGHDSVLAAPPTRDLAAYDLYLKGRFAWNQRTGTSLPQAARYFEQAVARDSTMARAYAGLADTDILLPSYAGASPAELWPKAKAAALRAIALDSTLADAHTSLAYGTFAYEWNWAEAEASFRRAIAADSTYPTAHHWYADYLAGRGRLDEAQREMQRAHELDPLSRIIGAELGWTYYLLHRNEEAQAEIRKVLALDPNFAHGYFILGLSQLAQRQFPEAIASFRRNLELDGGFHALGAASLCYALAASDDRAGAMKILQKLQKSAKREYVPAFTLAIAYAGLGDKTKAIAELNRGIDEHDILMPENFFDPQLDPLRSDPRFAEVERRMGLGH